MLLRSRVVVILAAAILLVPQVPSAFAATDWAGVWIKNKIGEDASDLHIVFSRKVRSIGGLTHFNTATPAGGAPSNTWDLSGGTVIGDGTDYERVRFESGAMTKERITKAWWTDGNGGQIGDDIDKKDIIGLRHTEVSWSVPSGAGIRARVVITNRDPTCPIRFENFEAYVGNDPTGVTPDDFDIPTGSLVTGLPSTIALAPGEAFDTGYLPEMEQGEYVILRGTLIEEDGSGDSTMEWAYGTDALAERAPTVSEWGVIVMVVVTLILATVILRRRRQAVLGAGGGRVRPSGY